MILNSSDQTDKMILRGIETQTKGRIFVAETLNMLIHHTRKNNLRVPFKIHALDAKLKKLRAEACDTCPMMIGTDEQKREVEKCKQIISSWVRQVKNYTVEVEDKKRKSYIIGQV